jgi:quinol monooxygenase YgiN
MAGPSRLAEGVRRDAGGPGEDGWIADGEYSGAGSEKGCVYPACSVTSTLLRRHFMALTVIAKFVAKAGKEEQLRKELLERIEPTRAEAGCIAYDLHQDIDNPAVLVFLESWKSKEDLEKHLQMPYLQSLLALVDDICVEPPEIRLANQIG